VFPTGPSIYMLLTLSLQKLYVRETHRRETHAHGDPITPHTLGSHSAR